MDIYSILEKVKIEKPLIHHLTNWVTIYDCANIVKAIGGSPVMAHAKGEVEEMANIASALVLNIGTLTPEFIDSMILAGKSANKKGIPIVLDVCGAGATKLRNDKCKELINNIKISIIKGNASEIASVAGENIKTKGVDSGNVEKDLKEIGKILAKKLDNTIVITGKEDIVTDGKRVYIVKNGCEMMSHVVGTGCMATSMIGTFSAVEKDLAIASVGALVCYEIAAELAFKQSKGPATFKEKLFDCLYNLTKKDIESLKKIS